MVTLNFHRDPFFLILTAITYLTRSPNNIFLFGSFVLPSIVPRASEAEREDAANDPATAGVAGALFDGGSSSGTMLSPLSAMGGDDDDDVRAARTGGSGE